MYLRNFCNFRYLWLLKCCRQFDFTHLKPKVFYCHHCTFLWCLWSLCMYHESMSSILCSFNKYELVI
jgi:hypothetical protein